MVRNGYHQPRKVTAAAGTVEVKAQRVEDKRVDGATGERKQFSPAPVTRLTAQWQADHKAFSERDLSATDHVYVWAGPASKFENIRSCWTARQDRAFRSASGSDRIAATKTTAPWPRCGWGVLNGTGSMSIR